MKDIIHNLILKNYSENGFVDVVKLANDLGIAVAVDKKPDDFNASIEYDNVKNQYSIIANYRHSMTRIRFSIAHEIAHFIMHKDHVEMNGKLNRDRKTRENYHVEKEADKMASEILMPEELIEEFLKSHGIQDKEKEILMDIVGEVAEKFRVSTVAAAIRLQDLGYYVSLTYVL